MRKAVVTSHEALMAQFQETLDTGAFEEIVSYYTCPAVGVAMRVLCERSLAEDAVQETFLRLIRKRRRYDPSKSFSTWFYTILRNVCIDMLRKKHRHAKAVEEISKQVEKSQRPAEFDVTDLLSTLPRQQRDVIELRIVHDLGFRDIAAALDISQEAAKKRAQRGLRRLREKIGQHKISVGKSRLRSISQTA